MVVTLGGAAVRPCAATSAPLENQTVQLDTIRQQCIAEALAVQQHERTIGALDLAIRAMQNGVDNKNQEIATSRAEQEALLGALERLALTPPEAAALAPGNPVDRSRGAILMAAAVPTLSARVRELSGQLAALVHVRSQLDTRRTEIDDARAALAKGRDTLAQLVARRSTLIAQMLHYDAKPTAPGQTNDQSGDLSDLIKRADAATEQRDKQLLLRLKMLSPVPGKPAASVTDPTKPKELRALDAPGAEMLWPASGELVRRYGEANRDGRPSQGLTLQGMPGGIVVSPFEGRADLIGRFEGYGLILIIRHAGGYHSLLAGLGHVDVATGQWLLAGEPIGSLPDADDKGVGVTAYLELRRDGRPVDPQSRLESRDQKTEDTRVRE